MPFPLLLPLITGIGSALGGIAKGRAEGRQAQAQANAQQDLAKSAQYNTQQQATQRAYELGMLNPRATQQDMLRGQMMASPPADLKLAHPRATMPQMQGGMSLSALDTPAGRMLGQTMQRNALMQGMKGYDAAKGTVLTPPGVTPQPQGNWLDTLLGIGGMAGAIGGGIYSGKNLQDLFNNPQAKQAFSPQLPGTEGF